MKESVTPTSPHPMELSTQAVKSLLSRARENLRQMLEPISITDAFPQTQSHGEELSDSAVGSSGFSAARAKCIDRIHVPRSPQRRCPASEELVAYLDGELGPEQSRRVEQRAGRRTRRAADARGVRRTWHLLDELESRPPAKTSPARRWKWSPWPRSGMPQKARPRPRGGIGVHSYGPSAGLAAAAVAGFLLVAGFAPDPNAQTPAGPAGPGELRPVPRDRRRGPGRVAGRRRGPAELARCHRGRWHRLSPQLERHETIRGGPPARQP